MTPVEIGLTIGGVVWFLGIVVFCFSWHRTRTPLRRALSRMNRDA